MQSYCPLTKSSFILVYFSFVVCDNVITKLLHNGEIANNEYTRRNKVVCNKLRYHCSLNFRELKVDLESTFVFRTECDFGILTK